MSQRCAIYVVKGGNRYKQHNNYDNLGLKPVSGSHVVHGCPTTGQADMPALAPATKTQACLLNISHTSGTWGYLGRPGGLIGRRR